MTRSIKTWPLCMIPLLAGLFASTPAIAQDETDPPPTPTTLSPVVSPDGTKIAFVSDATGSKNLWIADRSGANARPLTTWLTSDQLDPDWTPDGQRVVFSSTRNAADFNIWIISADGSGASQLTVNVGANRQPRVSPDGTKIVFTSNRTGKRELWYMGISGSNQKAIGLQTILVNDPAWSPNGQVVVYVGCTPPPNGGGLFEGSCNLFTITLDASLTVRVTSGQFQDWNPDWGSGGIVFSSTRGGTEGLWVVNPNGTNLRQVTHPAQSLDLLPRWDPRTGEIVFTRGENVWSSNGFGFEKQITAIKGFTQAGDVNTDGKIDCSDVGIVRVAFGKKTGQPGYDTRADINADGVVDVRDLAVVSRNLAAGVVCAQ